MMHVVCQQEKNTCTFYLFNKMLTIYFNTKCSEGTPIVEAPMVKISIKYQL